MPLRPPVLGVTVNGSFRFAESGAFDKSGKLIKTEQAIEGGNDGLLVLPDGTKYVSSVRFGSASRIKPGQPAQVIAAVIRSAASICYDAIQHPRIRTSG